jgi:O-antigen/teichoic acid export membrane protein
MIPILLFGTLLNTSNYVIGSGIYASGKTKYISIPPIVGGLVNLLFCWLFAVYFGLVGVAFSVVMGSFAYLSTSYFISQKHYPINYSIGKGFLVLTTLIAFMFAIHWVDSLSVQISYVEFGLKIILFLVAIVMIFLSRVYSFGEIENVLNKFVFSKLKRK